MGVHYWNGVPSVKYRRTKMKMPHDVSTSMNLGDLVPLCVVEALPGDNWYDKLTFVARSSSAFVKPIMGNIFLDLHAFFVPGRLLYKDFENVFGDSSPSSWTEDKLKSLPVYSSAQTISKGSVGDHLGLPVGTINLLKGKNCLVPRGFAKIYNDWFRNENVVDEVYIYNGSYDSTHEAFNDNDWSATNYTGKLPKVAKSKDFFTSCLKEPQKGPDVRLPLTGGKAPVFTDVENVPKDILENTYLNFYNRVAGDVPGSYDWKLYKTGAQDELLGLYGFGPNSYGALQAFTNSGENSRNADYLQPANLWADNSYDGALLGPLINEFRFNMQLQRMQELDARYGTRYCEYLYAHYGVLNGDARLQRSEYIGGSRVPLNIQQVTSNNGDSSGNLAELGAFSLTSGTNLCRVNKAVVEHGYIYFVGAIKQVHTYSQGIDKLWYRVNRNDFYDPLFANLGEQPVYVGQICANTEDAVYKNNLEDVFGYNEAWAEYRYIPNKLTGEMRPATNNLGEEWTIGDYYSNVPVISKAFVEETDTYVSNVLTGGSSVDNFILDIHFDTTAIRVMPLYSTPGRVDHTLGG